MEVEVDEGVFWKLELRGLDQELEEDELYELSPVAREAVALRAGIATEVDMVGPTAEVYRV